jgi:hypothetical protein
VDDHTAYVPIRGCQNLGSGRGASKEAPKMGRRSPAKDRVLATRFDSRDVVSLAAWGVMSDPINPSMKR